jgi:hypothetical protein
LTAGALVDLKHTHARPMDENIVWKQRLALPMAPPMLTMRIDWDVYYLRGRRREQAIAVSPVSPPPLNLQSKKLLARHTTFRMRKWELALAADPAAE